tara:strand:+ start:6307 stop:6729 length:423 start_codon:yes stop_codon:yes gene_type:complete
MIDIQIVGNNEKGGESVVRVSSKGQLSVGPLNHSVPVNVKAEVINTAYNLVVPVASKQIVITDIILTANKNVGVNDATVDIYEADSVDTTTINKSILQLEMLKNSNLVLTGLNLLVSSNKWVNVKTDDDDIFVTVMYYYL